MKLLIITQKIDKKDDVLGFMHGWISVFAAQCDEVIAVGLYVGEYDLPKNVRVFSLGKEKGVSRTIYLVNFFRIITRERLRYDSVFVHMNQIYVILGGMLWRLFGKKIALWYAHGSTPLSLRIALLLAHRVFTSTKSGFRLSSRKVVVVGQGIDTNRFTLMTHTWDGNSPFEIMIVGRISPVKDYETLLRATSALVTKKMNVHVTIVGGAGLPEQEAYLLSLKRLAEELKIAEVVRFTGGIPNDEIVRLLACAHVFVNTSNTGSFDKAVGEAMANGIPVLTSNEAFKEVLGDKANELMFPAGNEGALSERMETLMNMSDSERAALGGSLRSIIVERHSLDTFVGRIIDQL